MIVIFSLTISNKQQYRKERLLLFRNIDSKHNDSTSKTTKKVRNNVFRRILDIKRKLNNMKYSTKFHVVFKRQTYSVLTVYRDMIQLITQYKLILHCFIINDYMKRLLMQYQNSISLSSSYTHKFVLFLF